MRCERTWNFCNRWLLWTGHYAEQASSVTKMSSHHSGKNRLTTKMIVKKRPLVKTNRLFLSSRRAGLLMDGFCRRGWRRLMNAGKIARRRDSRTVGDFYTWQDRPEILQKAWFRNTALPGKELFHCSVSCQAFLMYFHGEREGWRKIKNHDCVVLSCLTQRSWKFVWCGRLYSYRLSHAVGGRRLPVDWGLCWHINN